jgi:zinc transport system ATP-binding protein
LERDRVLQVEDLNYKIGSTWILRGVSFNLSRGEFAGIIGPNGAGKTTLIKAIVGDLSNYSGSIKVAGRVGYLPQNPERSRDFPISVREVVAMGLYKEHGPFKRFLKSEWNTIDTLLKTTGMEGLGKRRAGTLSGGEYQRLMLARALASNPELLILDEPEAGVDEMGKSSFYRLLEKLKNEKNMGILMVSHDIGMVFEACDTIMCINKTLHCHTSADMISPEQLKSAFSTDLDLFIRSRDHFEREHGV